MTKKSILFLCLILNTLSAWAQQATDAEALEQDAVATNDTLYVDVVAYWELNEQKTIVVEKGKKKFENGTLVQADSSTTQFRISVTDSTDTSYTIRWHPIASNNSRTIPEFEEAINEEALWQVVDEGFVYRTSELGEYQELENGSVLVKMVAAAIDSMFAQIDEEKREAGKQLLDAFRQPALIEELFAEPIALYHQLHGYQYMIGYPWQYQEAFPNRFGGAPIPALGEAIVEEVDLVREEVTFRSRIEADSSAIHDMVIEVMVMASGKDVEEVKRAFQGVPLEMYQEEEYVIDYNWGWIRSLRWLRVVESGGTRQEQFYRMRLLEN